MEHIVAHFGKALNLERLGQAKETPSGQENLAQKETLLGKWFVLGYFDTLEIYVPYQREKDSWLNSMFTHNVELSKRLDGSFYYHPLHLFDMAPGEVGRFLGRDDDRPNMPYLFVTLVQSAALPPKGKQVCSEKLQKAIEEVTENNNQVTCMFCRTLELSDLVVLLRSNSLFSLTELLHEIYLLPDIGDMSTFAAIDQDYLLHDFVPGESGTQRELCIEMKCVVRRTKEINRYLELIAPYSGNAYFVTGVENLHIQWPRISEDVFLTFLQQIFLNRDINKSFCRAFSECITQIGIPEKGGGTDTEANEREQDDPKETLLTRACVNLLANFQHTRERRQYAWNNIDHAWLKSAHSLFNAMTDMSRNWVLDGFCYLILGAANRFCRDVEKKTALPSGLGQSSQPEGIDEKYLSGIQRFVRGWGVLMEQATRTDGRFIQMPGFSPAMCEIPARLLEFYLAFTQECAKMLCMQDKQYGDIALLLVPKICRRMKVESIFDEVRDIDHLLYVDIPLESLYSPTKVLCCLNHELAHFVGEQWRNRNRRSEEIIYVAAYELAAYLRMLSPGAVSNWYTYLRDQIPIDAGLYSKPLAAHLKGTIQGLLANEEHYCHIREEFRSEMQLRWSLSELSIWEIKNVRMRENLVSGSEEFKKRIDDIIYLFRECYADLCMINLLRPRRATYLALAEEELLLLDKMVSGNFDALEQDSRYTIIVERWAVLLGMDEIWLGDNGEYESVGAWLTARKNAPNISMLLDRFLEDISQRLISLNKEDQPAEGSFYHHSEVIRHLWDYLKDCQTAISETLGNLGTDKRNLLSKVLLDMEQGLPECYQECEQMIQEYRDSLQNYL